MIEAVRKHLKSEGYELRRDYDPVFEPARVPVFAYRGGETSAEVLVDIITEPRVRASSYFKDRTFTRTMNPVGLQLSGASSASFFRHYFPNALVYWALPGYVEKGPDYAAFVDNCRQTSIGVLEVSREHAGWPVQEVVAGLPLFRERISELNKGLRRRSAAGRKETIEKLLMKWGQEDLAYLVFYPRPKYLATDISKRDEFSISKELVYKMDELSNNISYKDILVRFGETYNETPKDDYEIALDVMNEIWEFYNIKYPNLHKGFDEVLKLDPLYRDHFLHAFQVFLYGVYITDKEYTSIAEVHFGHEKGDRLEDAWAFASTYHDFNLMIQNFDKWTLQFFIKALHFEEGEKNNPASLRLDESYVRKGYMVNTKKLLQNLRIETVDSVTLDFLYDRILSRKNHGLISALSLLKYLDLKGRSCLTERVVDAACKAISLHDFKVWGFLSGIASDDNNDVIGTKFKRKKILRRLAFKSDPISFLLVLADSLQEEGREREQRCKTKLEKLETDGQTVLTEISFSEDLKAAQGGDSQFDDKIKQLTNVKKFLDGGKNFRIEIVDQDTDQRHIFEI
jgi:hypothetical protein